MRRRQSNKNYRRLVERMQPGVEMLNGLGWFISLVYIKKLFRNGKVIPAQREEAPT